MSDPSLDSIYAAVGKAVTRWERLEAHLSLMYSIFQGEPLDYDTMVNYGRESKIFRDRISSLRASLERYFISNPDQQEEARAEALIAEAVSLSKYRNRIAHGAVLGGGQNGSVEYRVVPPIHGLFHLTKTDGEYAYESAQIDDFANQFAALARRVQRFNHERHPPKP